MEILMEDMLKRLETYYRNEGILAKPFTCRFKDACCGGNSKFTGPKSAFVSSGYERSDLPRLLFLSLDSGSGNAPPEKRLPPAIRRGGENMDVSALPKHKHWYRTHELAWCILKQFDSTLTLEGINRYFAHANSAKCCQNKPGRSQADARLFRNCRGYVAGELRVLQPDILVSQGNWAKWAIQSVVKEDHTQFDKFASVIQIADRELFWLHTYHPRAYGYFYRQRDNCRGWERYSRLIKDFMNSRMQR